MRGATPGRTESAAAVPPRTGTMARMKLRVVGLVLACSAGACEKREPAPPSPSAPSPSPSPQPGQPPKAPADAAPAGAPLQTKPPPAPRPSETIAISGGVPDFGCLGWSQARQLAACVVGDRGFNVGPTKVTLVLVSLDGATAPPPPLPLLDLQEEHPGPDELPPKLAEQLEASLDGFVALDRSGAHLAGIGEGSRLVDGPPLSVGGMTIEVQSERVAPASVAPQYHMVLTVRGPDGARHVLDDTTAPINQLHVRAFPLRDRAGRRVVIVERAYVVGDEGVMGRHAAVWRCTAKTCEEP